MRLIALLLSLALVSAAPAPTTSAAPGDEAWIARYAGPDFSDGAVGVAVAPDGAVVFVTGWSDTDAERFSSDIVTIAYDAGTGAELWRSAYDGPGGGWDHPNDIAASGSGDALYVVGGARGVSTGRDYVVLAMDPVTGAGRWVFTYDGPSDRRSLDSAQGIAVAADGTVVYVTGYSADGFTPGGSTNTDYATVAIDASSGDALWVARHDGIPHGRDYAFEVGIAGAGDVVAVTGWNAGHGESSNDAVTVAYDAQSGVERWVARYDGPGGTSDAAYAMAVSPDGATIWVTGTSAGFDPYRSRLLVVGYDALTGAENVAVLFAPERASAEGVDIAVSPDGDHIVIAGTRIGRGGFPCYQYDFLTVALDPSGTVQWSRRLDGLAGCYDYPSAVAFDPAGRVVYVAGTLNSTGRFSGQDVGVVAYDIAAGEPVWVSAYDGPRGRWDLANDVAVGADGGVFVVGESNGGETYLDFVAIRYEP